MSGLRIMNCRPRWLLMLLPIVSSVVHAGDMQMDKGQTDAIPSVEFLEFLGEWQTDEGEWIDPEELDDEDFANKLDDFTTTNSNE